MNTKTIRNLQEAYSDVYASQELTEDQIWEEVENWVNALLEEGYDLSDYTWEEMYEEWKQSIVEAFPNVKGNLGGPNPIDPKTGKSKYKMITDPKTGKPTEIENPGFGRLPGV